MPPTRKAVASALGVAAILSLATLAEAQRPGQPQAPVAQPAADSLQLTIPEATVDWFQKSDVSALTEGVVYKMEMRLGKEVGEGGTIGYLYDHKAKLAVEEAKVQAESVGPQMKAQAQKDLAAAVIARNMALNRRVPGSVSQEESQKAEAEYAVADASLIEAQETVRFSRAKLKSAEQLLDEHKIRAPFRGQILKEYKHEGESVRANEPVVQVGNLDTVRVWTYVPLDYAFRVEPGMEIVVQPYFGGNRYGSVHRGAITSVDATIQPVAEEAVRIYADLDNPRHELRPGGKVRMTLFLRPEAPGVAGPGAPKAGQAIGKTAAGSARDVELPALPR